MKKINLENNYIIGLKMLFDELYLEIIPNNGITDYIIGVIGSKRDFDGYYGINSIISGIKKVKIRHEEYMNKYEEEKGLFDESTEEGMKIGQEFWKSGKLRVIDINSGYDWDCKISDEYKKWLFYSWGSETHSANSFIDITVVEDNFSDTKEYYKTSEVLEVLEKWKEALERWNNPNEKKKMIEEYEREKS